MEYFTDYWYVTHYVDIYHKCDHRKRYIRKCVVEYVVYKILNNCYSFVVNCDYNREYYNYQRAIVDVIDQLYGSHSLGYRYFSRFYGPYTTGIHYSND